MVTRPLKQHQKPAAFYRPALAERDLRRNPSVSYPLLSFPQPLLTRYLIDHVILGKHLELLAGVILLLAGFACLSILGNLLQEFFFSRYEQEVLLDLQQNLLERAFRFPKAFFDTQQTGDLISRLSSGVQELRCFFPAPLSIWPITFPVFWRDRFSVLPGTETDRRGSSCSSGNLLSGALLFPEDACALGQQSMEQHPRVSSCLEESLSASSLIIAFSTETRTAGRLTSG